MTEQGSGWPDPTLLLSALEIRDPYGYIMYFQSLKDRGVQAKMGDQPNLWERVLKSEEQGQVYRKLECVQSRIADRSGLKVPFARCAHHTARHVDMVTRDAGPFTCLQCEELLLYRCGPRTRAHFAHRSDSMCSGETVIHRYAKEVFSREKSLTLPRLVLSLEGLREVVFKGGRWDFDEVEIERGLDLFRPDALARKSGATVAVEFRVTHAVDEAKREKVARRDVSTVEVDLSPRRLRDITATDLDDHILHVAPREWIHHRKRSGAVDKLKTKVAEQRTSRKAALLDRLLKPPTATYNEEWSADLLSFVAEAGLTHATGLATSQGHWFTVPPVIWQAGLLAHFVIKPARLYSPGSELKVEPEWQARQGFASALEPWTVRQDLGAVDGAVLNEAGLSRKQFGSPMTAAWEYFAELVASADVVGWDPGRSIFYVEPSLHQRLYNVGEIRSLSVRLLEAAGDSDPAAASEAWQSSVLDAGGTPLERAIAGGEDYSLLIGQLRRLIHMTHGWAEDSVEDDLLGLPIEPLRLKALERVDAAAKRRQAVAEQALQERTNWIEAEARRLLEDEARDWLDAIDEASSRSRLETASETQEKTDLLISRLYSAHRDRRARLAREFEKVEVQAELRDLAMKAFSDPRHAELFLNSGQRRLDGMKPIDFCDNSAKLKVVKELLPHRRG